VRAAFSLSRALQLGLPSHVAAIEEVSEYASKVCRFAFQTQQQANMCQACRAWIHGVLESVAAGTCRLPWCTWCTWYSLIKLPARHDLPAVSAISGAAASDTLKFAPTACTHQFYQRTPEPATCAECLQEYSLETALDKMQAEWAGLCFDTLAWRATGCTILRGVDDIQQVTYGRHKQDAVP
jgi:hypothetical protein